MPSSPPRRHRVRERDKLILQGYFTTDRAPLRGASMRARDQSSGVAGMIRVSRDWAKLRDDHSVEFVVRLEHPIDPNGKARVCWAYWDPYVGSWNGQNQPLMQAFEATYKFASDNRFSAIWIRDVDVDTVGLWVPSGLIENGLIDYLDDHS
jgi:hypothetical protein